MKKSERTRQFIVEKTAPVFNTQGFYGTSLASLEAATGLTKGSLYGNFAGKEELALEVFHYSFDFTRTEFNKRVAAKNTAKEKLLAFLQCFAEYVFNPPIPGGCPILNNAIESDDLNPVMKNAVAEAIEGVLLSLIKLIDEGKRKGEFKQDVKSRELAYIFFASVEGAIMMSRATSSEAPMKAIVKHNKEILEQISL